MAFSDESRSLGACKTEVLRLSPSASGLHGTPSAARTALLYGTIRPIIPQPDRLPRTRKFYEIRHKMVGFLSGRNGKVPAIFWSVRQKDFPDGRSPESECVNAILRVTRIPRRPAARRSGSGW